MANVIGFKNRLGGQWVS